MKLEKLAKQARRDLLAHPKKAAALGLMLLVALYFWAPLAWKWMAPGSGKAKASTEQTALILEDDPILPTAKAKTGKAAPFRWERVRQLIQADRHMVPAAFDPAWSNPFAAPPPAAPEQTNAEGTNGLGTEQAVATAAGNTGLKLAGVAIGPRRRTATINGDTYREGDVISLTANDATAQTTGFRLIKVERHGVQLESKGKTFWLEFDQPKLAQGDEIQRSGGSQPK